MSGTYKYAMKTPTVSIKMDGNIRSPKHSAVITAALAGNLVDDVKLLHVASVMLTVCKRVVSEIDSVCLVERDHPQAALADLLRDAIEAVAQAEGRE